MNVLDVSRRIVCSFTPIGSFPSLGANCYSWVDLRDSFNLFTWLVLGAVLQGLASLYLSPRYVLLPVIGYLLHRALWTLFMYRGLVRNPHMDEVMIGKFTAQIPGRDGSPPQQAAEQDITVIILAARSN